MAAIACGLSVFGIEGMMTIPSHVAGAAAPMQVASTTLTFVDSSRATPPWNGSSGMPSRTLVTTIWYPAQGPGSGAPSGQGHFPLIVFAHGLDGSPQGYQQLLTAWASAGYVVAAPLFPLSSNQTPGGADGGDIGNQPGDMSFVIDQVLKASASPTGPLAGMVDPSEIGAAGHSNGAITTLGLVANSCCHDTRIKAAVVMAGTTEGLGRGHYQLADSPPLLIVSDVHDGLVPYADAVAVFNQARGPKALLTLDWDSASDASGSTAHMASSGVVGPTSARVVASTTAFFNAFLKHDNAALRSVSSEGRSTQSVVHAAWTEGSRATLSAPKQAPVHLHASVTPDAGLHDGQAVTVHWHGYTPGKVVNILECSHVDIASSSSAGCSFDHAAILHPDPTGSGSVVLHVGTGAIGTGVCDPAHTCYVIVNNASSTDPADTKKLPIRFAS